MKCEKREPYQLFIDGHWAMQKRKNEACVFSTNGEVLAVIQDGDARMLSERYLRHAYTDGGLLIHRVVA